VRYREIQGDTGRYREIQGDECGELRDGGLGRYREMHGDTGEIQVRCGQLRGGRTAVLPEDGSWRHRAQLLAQR
jgi:hypothetical protein